MRVACPGCGSETVLQAQAVAAPSEEISAAELQSAMAGPVSRQRISIFYQIALLLVALFMVLLPVIYLAFACLAGYGVYWYAIHGLVLFSSFTGGGYVFILKTVLYLGPLIGGTVAVLFMFKPLLARSPKRAEPIELNPAQHPRLYQFIAQLSDLLPVSMPKRIYLDCDLNASAGLRPGWFSILGKDLELTVGLPLVGGLNTRQFAAVISHELGHCTQWLAMRLGYVIHRINRWFYRVVYERDTWDEALEDWSNSVEDSRLSLVVACVHLAVWLSRRVLLTLMLTGHAASCFLSRQMEYHADACALSVAGSAGLESLLVRLRELDLLQGLGYDGLRKFWQKRHQLPESLPDFLDQLERRLPPAFHEDARMTLLNEKAGWFATHPTAAQRIKQARKQSLEGIFALEKPARALFRDFPTTARLVSSLHYRRTLGLAVTNPMLKPVADFFQESAAKA